MRPGLAWLVAPIGAALGVSAYFSLPFEPSGDSLALFALTGLAMLGLALAGRFDQRALLVLLCAACAALGLARAGQRTQALSAPVVADSDRARPATGWIERIETSRGRDRLVMRLSALEGMETPPVRIRATASRGDFEPGDAISLPVVLRPPPRPAAPGGYDFGFHAHFRQLGGTGYAIGAPEAVVHDGERAARALARFRWRLSERIRAQMPEASGGVAAALLTGDRSGIPPEIAENLRRAGLGHILAISGLHMALLAGGVFFAVRLALAAWPAYARGRDPRRPAALIALVAATGYLLLTGGAIPTQRAYLMTASALLAWIAGRRALSMHTLAAAMLAVLALQPESLRSPGFQMSFGAAAALVAVYEALRERRDPSGRSGPVSGFLGGLSTTSLIAGLATGVFSAFHFNRLAVWGFPANLFAMPVFSLLVMPAGVFALALMPLGIEGPFLWVMGEGLELVFFIAAQAAEAPGAIRGGGGGPGWTLGLYGLGFAAMCAGRGWMRAGGALVALIALAAWSLAPAPDLFIAEDGRALVRGEDGGWRRLASGRTRFSERVFLESQGLFEHAETVEGLCDAIGCTHAGRAGRVLLARRLDTLGEDCARSSVLIVEDRLPPWRRLHCSALVFDPADLAREGAALIRIDGEGGWRIRRSEDGRRGRPWSRLD